MNNEEKSDALTLLDDNKLRRAAVRSLLRPWAERHRVVIDALGTGKLAAGSDLMPTTRLILINTGGESMSNPQHRRLMRLIVGALPGIPVVILSDLEEAEEVVAAFEGGAQGFVPTSLEPDIALQALSLIFKGGSFFPASTLHYLTDKSRGYGAEIAASVGCGMARLTRREDHPPMMQASAAEIMPVGGYAGAFPQAFHDVLTERQQHVLKLLRTGQSNKKIARELNMTEATVKVHVRHVMRKLGASNRTEAAILATKLDLDASAPGIPIRGAAQPECDTRGQHRVDAMLAAKLELETPAPAFPTRDAGQPEYGGGTLRSRISAFARCSSSSDMERRKDGGAGWTTKIAFRLQGKIGTRSVVEPSTDAADYVWITKKSAQESGS
jgi:DNA-binding NarL/FixJ family response regulator